MQKLLVDLEFGQPSMTADNKREKTVEHYFTIQQQMGESGIFISV